MIARRLRAHGRVQGVGYRSAMVDAATLALNDALADAATEARRLYGKASPLSS